MGPFVYYRVAGLPKAMRSRNIKFLNFSIKLIHNPSTNIPTATGNGAGVYPNPKSLSNLNLLSIYSHSTDDREASESVFSLQCDKVFDIQTD